MNIGKLNDYAVKIHLDKGDMEYFCIDYLDIDAKAVKNIIEEISEEISEIIGIELNNEKIFVEVFAKKDDCLIFISFSSKKTKIKNLKRNIILQFDDFDDLKKFCCSINEEYNGNIIFSKLYCNSKYIRMILGVKSEYDNIIKMSSGLCSVIKGNEINIAATNEYFHCVYSSNAIENILIFTRK